MRAMLVAPSGRRVVSLRLSVLYVANGLKATREECTARKPVTRRHGERGILGGRLSRTGDHTSDDIWSTELPNYETHRTETGHTLLDLFIEVQKVSAGMMPAVNGTLGKTFTTFTTFTTRLQTPKKR
jgi:hypothetical protein